MPFGFLAASFLAGSSFFFSASSASPDDQLVAFGEDGPAVAQGVDDPFVGRDQHVALVGEEPLPRQEEALVLKRQQRPSGVSLRSSWSRFLQPGRPGPDADDLEVAERVGQRAELVLDQLLARGQARPSSTGLIQSLRVIVDFSPRCKHQAARPVGIFLDLVIVEDDAADLAGFDLEQVGLDPVGEPGRGLGLDVHAVDPLLAGHAHVLLARAVFALGPLDLVADDDVGEHLLRRVAQRDPLAASLEAS